MRSEILTHFHALLSTVDAFARVGKLGPQPDTRLMSQPVYTRDGGSVKSIMPSSFCLYETNVGGFGVSVQLYCAML